MQQKYYTSFSGISPGERRALVHFIVRNSKHASGKQVSEALDYALKRKPSFGGHILCARDGARIVSALVVNRTGMKGYSPNHLVVFSVFDKNHEKAESSLMGLIEKAIDLTRGDLALQVIPGSSALDLYEKLGFQPQYVQLHLDRSNVVV